MFLVKIIKLLEKYTVEIVILSIGTIFGIFLMFSSFAKSENVLFISTKAWSDFASHIPLIRSFSMGSNFPPEYPLFAGPVIKYHFGFYAGVGILEKMGIPIDLALNIPSTLGFILLIFMIYYFANKIFKSKTVGVLSVLFFLFNSSLSYIYYFQKKSLSLKSFLEIPHIKEFQSFAPYDDGLISAFWNLNIYTNQRHLPLSFAISLMVILIFIKPLLEKKKINYKISIFLGVILGASFFLHFAVLIMTASIIIFLGILFSKIRKSALIILIIGGLITLPQYLYINSSNSNSSFMFNIGYLISDKFTLSNFFEFWILNLGLSIILIPLGFYYANKFQKKILLSIIPLFLIGNLFQFSPEIAANHKFFNYFLMIGNMYSAYALTILWNKKIIYKPLVAIAIFLMIFGGILDIFPLINDRKVSIPDFEINPNTKWIIENTSPDSVFLNTTFLYNPASIAGRKIFIGWPYFAWSQGYDTNTRGIEFEKLLTEKSKDVLCKRLINNNIDYIEINTTNPDQNIPTVSSIFNDELNFSYSNTNGYKIYEVKSNCK